jgi:uncharacterized OB-fold protein
MSNGSLPLLWRKFPERYLMQGNKCETCGTAFFPARKLCPNCRRKGKLVPEKMPHSGKIITFTEVFSAPYGFEMETPYFIAIIKLSNGAKILSQVVDSKKEKIKIGTEVKRVFRKISDIDPEGPIAYGYKFKVVE